MNSSSELRPIFTSAFLASYPVPFTSFAHTHRSSKRLQAHHCRYSISDFTCYRPSSNSCVWQMDPRAHPYSRFRYSYDSNGQSCSRILPNHGAQLPALPSNCSIGRSSYAFSAMCPLSPFSSIPTSSLYQPSFTCPIDALRLFHRWSSSSSSQT